jgi:hypothetical protein
MKHTSALCGQNAEFQYAKVSGTYSDHSILKGQYAVHQVWTEMQ